MTDIAHIRAAANDEAFARLVAARPRLVGAALAGELIPELRERRVHHAGPPIPFAEMCAPLQGALACAVMLEGWAPDASSALALLGAGAVTTGANNDHASVGPMAGPISASTPVWVVEESGSGAIVVTPFHEGFGHAQCMGSTSDETLERLRITGGEIVPVIDAALRAGGGIDLTPWVAEAILRGDELHNRCVAGTSMLVERLGLYGLEAGVDAPRLAGALKILAVNGQTAATPVMAWAKSMLDCASGVPGSSIVTAYARNGTTVGLKLSGTGDQWFTAPGMLIKAKYLEGFGDEDATLDLGDSAAAEIGGVGAFVAAASPAFARMVGETPADGIEHTLSMYPLCHGESPHVVLPVLDWRGAPLGIDAALVVSTGVAPIHNTAVANKIAGAGIVGTGLVRGAMGCYEQAMAALADAPVAA
jgi:hypothetical protein